MLKANIKDWISATANLNERRKYTGINNDIVTDGSISDYGSHLRKCRYGNSILDVGCGSQTLKKHLPDGFNYIGLDAFPLEGVDCIEGAIEDVTEIEVDTVCAFAVLDNCRDFDAACENMKRIAQQNIIILTGIGINPDKYHTFRLELSDFDRCFSNWTCTHREKITNKVWLINYQKSV